MTREEAKRRIEICRDFLANNYSDIGEPNFTAFNMAIQALSQEPCEDEYIKVPKKALKYRTAGMVAYNAEWLKNNFDIERAVICGVQEPTVTSTDEPMTMVYPTIVCDDAISREVTTKHIKNRLYETACNNTTYQCYADEVFADIAEHRIETWINEIPSVTQKSGKWIEHPEIETSTPEYLMFYECSECGDKQCFYKLDIHKKHFCNNCGAKMVDSQESEE